MAVGGTLAWLLARTDMFGRRWFATALIVPYMLPAWTFALAWTTLFKNRTVGGQAGWLETFGFSPPDWLAYGRVPVTIILALHYAPFVILLFGNALRRFDSQLEDLARILGAGRLTVMRQIILPLMRPALMSAMVLIFAKCLGEFGVPYVLGLPVAFDTLATSLYQNIASRQSGVAAVLAGAIMLIGVLTLTIDAYLMREARRFVTIGSKGSMDRLSPLGRWRWGATGFAALMFALSVGLPLLTLVLSTVMKVPGGSPSTASPWTTGSAPGSTQWRCRAGSCSAPTCGTRPGTASGTDSPNAARLFIHHVLTAEGIAPQVTDGKLPTNPEIGLPPDVPSGIGGVLDRLEQYDASTALDDWDMRQDWQDLWRINYAK